MKNSSLKIKAKFFVDISLNNAIKLINEHLMKRNYQQPTCINSCIWKPDIENQTLTWGEPLIEGQQKNSIFIAI